MDELLEGLKRNKQPVIIGVILLILLAGYQLIWSVPKQNTPDFPKTTSLNQVKSQKNKVKKDEGTSIEKPNKALFVDIKGAVAKEGVYELPAGSRVVDAINLAGGMTAEADKNSVNLAQKLEDETVVYVAKVGESESPPLPVDNTTGNSRNDSKVNLNTATVEDLTKLSGIGDKRAQDIIDYREANGGFKNVEELKNVSGIGDKTYEKLVEEVTID